MCALAHSLQANVKPTHQHIATERSTRHFQTRSSLLCTKASLAAQRNTDPATSNRERIYAQQQREIHRRTSREQHARMR